MKITIDFKVFSDNCKFEGTGRENGEYIQVCNHNSNIPKGHSWGKCNIKSCPLLKSNK